MNEEFIDMFVYFGAFVGFLKGYFIDFIGYIDSLKIYGR